MQKFTLQTLIDITQTNIFRHQPGEELTKNQQQNFAMLLQTIGLRANPIFDRRPRVDTVDVNTMFFGSAYRGQHRVWTFDFAIEYDGAFQDRSGNACGELIRDLHFVPIIDQLTETISIRLPVFDTSTQEYRNTVVYTETDK
jgi:hypothetical protein